MKISLLDPFDWKVDPLQENAIVAIQTSDIFTVSQHCDVIVTNHIGRVKYPHWMVLERCKEVVLGSGNLILSFVDKKYSHTDALNTAREYAWTVFRRDIAYPEIPF